jgi:hypothetical protein
MVRTALLILLGALLATLGACGDDGPSAPPTSEATAANLFLPSVIYSPEPYQSPTPGPPFPHTPTTPPEEWTEAAVWPDYFEGSALFDACYPALEPDCVIRVAVEEEEVTADGVAFFEQHETILASFEELGAVDFGYVAWPGVNMGRPEPVLLNGDFGLIYYGSLIPEDWREGEASYEALFVDAGAGLGPFAWGDRSLLAEADGDGGQRIVVESLIQGCRACEVLAFLALELTFDSDGALDSVNVLPMRCKSAVYERIAIEEGPCAQP